MNDNTFSHTEDAPQTHAQNGDSESTTDFFYTYSAKQHREIESIRMKYLSPEENKLEQLHRLDRQAERPGTIISIIMGVFSSLLLGIGMVMTMVYTCYFVLGIVVGLIGIAGVTLTYPLYLHITKRERRKIAPQILQLSDDLLKGDK